MSLFSNATLLTAASLLSVSLLSACTSVYDMPLNIANCPSKPDTLNKSFAQQYGHKDVLRKVIEAEDYVTQNNLQKALTAVSEGLALPNINAYGRSVLYRSKGQAYFNAKKFDEGIKAFETSVAQGGFDDGEAGFMVELIENAKKHGKLNPGDIDVQPLVRVPPLFPPNLNESGHCRVKLDVTKQGVPVNVQTTFCTNVLLEKVTINSVNKWKYSPKIVDGQAVVREGVVAKITYKLTDECGIVIPEPS